MELCEIQTSSMLAVWNFVHVLTAAVYITWWGSNGKVCKMMMSHFRTVFIAVETPRASSTKLRYHNTKAKRERKKSILTSYLEFCTSNSRKSIIYFINLLHQFHQDGLTQPLKKKSNVWAEPIPPMFYMQ